MRYSTVFRTFTSFIVVAASLFSFASIANAKGAYATVGTTLTIEPPVSVSVGNPSTVVFRLVSTKGEPVVDQRIEIFVDGVRERSVRTDNKGMASVRIRRAVAGTYELSATFKGSKLPSLGTSNASAELVITPEIVEVHVTPPLPGIKFSLNGRIFSSDDYGVARVEVKEAGKYDLDILPVELNDETIQMQFGRWGDESFEPAREIEIPLNRPLEVGFEVSYHVDQTLSIWTINLLTHLESLRSLTKAAMAQRLRLKTPVPTGCRRVVSSV
jgi:hypothetical protein